MVNPSLIVPHTSPAVLRWQEHVLHERFGHTFHLHHESHVLYMGLLGSTSTITFDRLLNVFNECRSDFHCHRWNAKAEGFQGVVTDAIPAPSPIHLECPLIEKTSGGMTIHYDILGLMYWMLTRAEEVGRTDLDEHDRFPAIRSHAHQHGYLERPIVDEWMHILGQVIQRQWPGISLKEHRFRTILSHDVDRPSRYGFANVPNIVRRMAGDLTRFDLRSALSAPLLRLGTRTRLHQADPFNTFSWIMDQSEKIGIKSAFYFICGHTSTARDGDYTIDHPAIRDLMRRIYLRGHEIGLHPSYNTYQDPGILRAEAETLRRICAAEGIHQSTWGGRMHYLRWSQPSTLRAWNDAGMDYDSTLTYADRPGFRCGTCYEYPAFDPCSGQILHLRIRPLVVMDGSVVNPKYMGLGNKEEATAILLQLRRRCEECNGLFTLLWHNSELNHTMKPIYNAAVNGISECENI